MHPSHEMRRRDPAVIRETELTREFGCIFVSRKQQIESNAYLRNGEETYDPGALSNCLINLVERIPYTEHLSKN